MADRRLAVEIDGLRVAHIEARRWNDLRCRYTQDAFDHWQQNTPLLSCSLPLAPGPLEATAFCRGLVAEGRALDAMASRAGVATNDTFGLLSRYGRDVAGAISLVPTGEEADRRTSSTEPYDEQQLTQAVANLDDNPLGIEDDSELSLAGLQSKLLLVKTGSGWARPVGGAVSTHILKVDDPRFPGLIEAEHACLELAAASGIAAAKSKLEQVGSQRCLIVTRFDRIHNGAARRIHQEDACQALGVDPCDGRGRAKYERAGGPSFAAVAGLLDRFASDGLAEMERLLGYATFTVIVGNADAHGKNISLLHEPLGTTRLAPMYDVVPTVLWQSLRTEPAMRIGSAKDIREAGRSDLLAEATAWGVPEARAEAVVDGVCERVSAALEGGVVDHQGVATQARAATARITADE